jgi:glycine/D-amino acid oxidase-like deaminating enzyme
MTAVGAHGSVSLWLDTLGEEITPRPRLEGDTDADAAIVGAGYTGLWTAYYLAVVDPSLRVVGVERETAGFGASGRNGGWASAIFPASNAGLRLASAADAVERRRGRPSRLAKALSRLTGH